MCFLIFRLQVRNFHATMFRGIKQIPLPRNTIRSCIAKKPKSVLDFG